MELAIVFVICGILLMIYTAVKTKTRGDDMATCQNPHCNNKDGQPLWLRNECETLVLFFGLKRTDVLCGFCIKTLLWLRKKMIIDLKGGDE